MNGFPRGPTTTSILVTSSSIQKWIWPGLVKDSLSDHNGSPFRTRDKVYKHCTNEMFGGWWYINNTNCAVSSNLNGAHHCKKRKRNMNETLGELKIHWSMLSGTDASHTSPLTSEMKIKPVDLPFKC